MTIRTPTLDTATVRRLAAEASVDPRTIVRVASGGKARGMADDRAREVLAAHGIEIPDAAGEATPC